MSKSWRDVKDFDKVKFKPKKKLRVKIRPEKVCLIETDKTDEKELEQIS